MAPAISTVVGTGHARARLVLLCQRVIAHAYPGFVPPPNALADGPILTRKGDRACHVMVRAAGVPNAAHCKRTRVRDYPGPRARVLPLPGRRIPCLDPVPDHVWIVRGWLGVAKDHRHDLALASRSPKDGADDTRP